MRRFQGAVALLLLVFLLLPAFSGCAALSSWDTPDVVCTVYPIYDWTLAILGDYAEDYSVLLLSDNGNDPHNYQPTVREIAAIRDAAVFLSLGGVSDAWADEVAEPSGRWLAMIDAVELCESAHEHSHGNDDGHGHGHAETHSDVDEHFWLSLRNAERAVLAIAELLIEVYGEETDAAAAFRLNAERYVEALRELDARYVEALASKERDTVLVADRFPYLYLMNDYGIRYHAAFPGCSAETEASFATVASLSDALKNEGMPAVIITETGKRDLADTVIAASGRTDVAVLVLHSCQSVTKRDRDGGANYLSIMEENLAVLTAALAS